MRVLLADEHPVVVEGLRALLSREPDIQLLGAAHSESEALARARSLHPDVILLGTTAEAAGRTRRLISQVAIASPRSRTLLLCFGEGAFALGLALEGGAAGCLTKRAGRAEIAHAIRQAANGRFFADLPDTEGLRASGDGSARHGLTDRECQILVLVAKGLTSRQVSERLVISPKTVDTHRDRIQRKLGAKGRSGLFEAARKLGLLTVLLGLASGLAPGLPAHPGPVDALGGHFTDPRARRGYHRHTSPLYRTDYPEQDLAAAEAQRRGAPRPLASSRSPGELESAREADTPFRRHLLQRIGIERQATETRTALRRSAFAGTALVHAREGSDLRATRESGTPLRPGSPVAVYLVPPDGAPELVGRALVRDAIGASLIARVLGRRLPLDPAADPLRRLVLTPLPLADCDRLPDPDRFERFLAGRPWRGMDLEALLAMAGPPRRRRALSAANGSDERIELRDGRSFHFRNGALVFGASLREDDR